MSSLIQPPPHPTDWFCKAHWGVNIAFMAIEGESTVGAEIPADEWNRHPKPPNFASFARALRAGNPRALVAFNPGQIVPLICHSEEDDYTAGEVDKQFPLCPGRWVERNRHAAQWHVYTWIGAQWGRGMTPRLPMQFVVGYTRQVAANQGVVTWDVPFHPDGTIPDPFERILEAVAKAVQPEKTS